MILDENGDREPDFWVMDMNPTTGIFERMAELINGEDRSRVMKNI